MFWDGGVGSRGDFMISLGVLYCMACMVMLGCWSWVFVLVFPCCCKHCFLWDCHMVVLEGCKQFFVVFCGAEGLQALSSVVVLTDGLERLFWYCRICVGLVVLMMCLFCCWGIGMWGSPLWHICGLSLLFLVLFCNKILENTRMWDSFA